MKTKIFTNKCAEMFLPNLDKRRLKDAQSLINDGLLQLLFVKQFRFLYEWSMNTVTFIFLHLCVYLSI